MIKSEYYKSRAIEYAEEYGIIEYRIKGNTMIYNVSYPKYLNQPRYTIQHIVNLDNFTSTTKTLQRYDSRGVYNRH